MGDDLLHTQSTILPNFIALRQQTPEIPLTTNLAQKQRNSKRYIYPQHAYPHVEIITLLTPDLNQKHLTYTSSTMPTVVYNPDVVATIAQTTLGRLVDNSLATANN